MINCNDNRNDEAFIKYYEIYDDVIKFYTKDGVFTILNTSDNVKRLDNIMDGQALGNISCLKSRIKELLFGIPFLPYFGYLLGDSFSSLASSFDGGNLFVFGASLAALATDVYYVVSRGGMIKESVKDKFYIQNIDYINNYINDENIRSMFPNLDSYLDEDGKIKLSMNDVDGMSLVDLKSFKIVIDNIVDKSKNTDIVDGFDVKEQDLDSLNDNSSLKFDEKSKNKKRFRK